MLDAELIKVHLHLDDDEFTDQLPLLTAYARAAWRLIENRTGRALFAVLPEIAPENALLLDDDVRLAMLLLVAHWYSNREAISEGAPVPIPLAFDALIGPYRWVTL